MKNNWELQIENQQLKESMRKVLIENSTLRRQLDHLTAKYMSALEALVVKLRG